MKVCVTCGERKPLDAFRIDSRCVDGRGSWCKRCVDRRRQEWRTGRRAAYFAGKSCVWPFADGALCGATERLELDHIDPATKVTSSIWDWSQERQDAELTKCQVLCHAHHEQKTNENRDRVRQGEDHGNAKLTNETVLAIRAAYQSGMASQSALARANGVSQNAIWRIVHKKGWAHV